MIRSVIVGVVMFSVAAAAAGATEIGVVYDNEVDPFGGGVVLDYAVSADDFQLPVDHPVNRATIALYGSSTAWWDLSGEWAIFDDASGTPGSVLATGNALNPKVLTGGALVIYEFDFGETVLISGLTTHWFSFHALNVGASSGALGWQGQPTVTGERTHYISLGGVADPELPVYGVVDDYPDWRELTVSADLVFSLVFVPEPSTASLTALGLAGLAAVRRKVR